ncbi:hypothetical protein IFVP177_C1120030 [Vibrio parahaemolyticus]
MSLQGSQDVQKQALYSRPVNRAHPFYHCLLWYRYGTERKASCR